MKSFEQIEKDFLSIESNDLNGVLSFYEANKELIKDYLNLKYEYKLEKSIFILSEVAQAYFELKQDRKGYKLALKVQKWFELYSKKYQKDLTINNFYKSTLWTIAQYSFDKKKYLNAYFRFKRLCLFDKHNKNFVDSKNMSFFRLTNRVSNISLGIAVGILILKLSIVNLVDSKISDSFFWWSVDLFFFAIYITGYLITKLKRIKQSKICS